jgi:hypothetical protein
MNPPLVRELWFIVGHLEIPRKNLKEVSKALSRSSIVL